MKIFKKKSLCALLLVGCLTAGGVGVASMLDNRVEEASAHTVALSSDALLDTYYVDQTLTLPASVSVEYENQTYTLTDAIVYYPNNTAKQGDTHTLSFAGDYKIVYTLKLEGVVLQAEKTVRVINRNWRVHSDSSTVEYTTLQVKNSSKPDGTAMSGLSVNLAAGDTFEYTVPIDISQQTLNNFVTINPLQTANTAQAQDVIVRLTDAYDPTNYIDFLLWYNAGDSINARAGGGKQGVSGVSVDARDFVDTKPVFFDGVRHLAWYSRYGCTLKTGANAGSSTGYSWIYNSETHEIRLDHQRGVAGGDLVTQLRNEDIYGDALFEGFTTGEVYLSVYADRYVGSSVQFEISRINGLTGTKLQLADYEDTKAPLLDVDYTPTTDNAVFVAQGEEVAVFDAKVWDVSKSSLDVSVYYNYESNAPSSVYLKDGKFTAALPGAYTIVYVATDAFGNTTSEKVVVNSVDKENGKAIDFAVEALTEIFAGKETVLPVYEVSGLNGDVSVETRVIAPNGTATVVNDKFLPLYVGTYTVEYRYYDAISEYTHSYTVPCKTSDAELFLDQLSVPRYFIKDAKYSLDDLKAYVFTADQPTAVNAEFFVRYDGETEYVKTNVNEFTVTGSESAQVKYVYGDAMLESPVIPIVDVGFGGSIVLGGYFQGDFEIEETYDSVRYTSNQTKGDNRLQFINTVSFSNLELNFTVPLGAYYRGLKITLTDYYDRSNTTVIEFYNVDGRLTAVVDGTLYKGTGNFADGNVKRFFYNNSTNKFIMPNGTSVAYLNKFTTDNCLLDIELIGITGEAYLDVHTINGQPFQKTFFDVIQPMIFIKSPAGQRSLGDEIVLEPASYTDVISPSLYGMLKLAVTDPSGNYVTSKEGILMDGTVLGTQRYTFDATKYGNYRITYSTQDQSGNSYAATPVVIIADETAPTVTINGSNTVTVKRLSVYTINNFTVADNYSATEKLTVTPIVIDEKHHSVISVGTRFEAKYAGTYTVYVYCEDEAGNSSYATFTLIVE